MTIEVAQKQYTLDEAFDYCARLTEAHYENFPVASLFLPAEKRPYIQAIYAFSRVADDFADEGDASPEQRMNALDDWGSQLIQCYEGNAIHPVFIALRDTVLHLRIPIDPLQNLLSAFKQDVVQRRYETYVDLCGYCRNSANPVGRLVLMIFGCRDEELFTLSDKICTALQLTNFWQDVDVDRLKDRLYIPLEDMSKFGYTIDDWQSRRANSAFREMMQFEVQRTRDLFYEGAALPSLVERELQVELRMVWFGGMAILKSLDKIKCDVFNRRPSLSLPKKFMVLMRGLFINDLRRYGKKDEEWPQE